MKTALAILTILGSVFSICAQTISEEEYMDAYIVVSDTSKDYYTLRNKMFQLGKNLVVEIDTMGRGFDTKKNRFAYLKMMRMKYMRAAISPEGIPQKL